VEIPAFDLHVVSNQSNQSVADLFTALGFVGISRVQVHLTFSYHGFVQCITCATDSIVYVYPYFIKNTTSCLWKGNVHTFQDQNLILPVPLSPTWSAQPALPPPKRGRCRSPAPALPAKLATTFTVSSVAALVAAVLVSVPVAAPVAFAPLAAVSVSVPVAAPLAAAPVAAVSVSVPVFAPPVAVLLVVVFVSVPVADPLAVAPVAAVSVSVPVFAPPVAVLLVAVFVSVPVADPLAPAPVAAVFVSVPVFAPLLALPLVVSVSSYFPF